MQLIDGVWVHKRVQTAVGTRSMTKQSMAAACDVNAIMRKYLSTGVLEHVKERDPLYGDFTDVEDYHASVNRVRAAQETFDGLPASIRDHCDNDPAELVRMALDPERREEMEELGLLPPREPAASSIPQNPPIRIRTHLIRARKRHTPFHVIRARKWYRPFHVIRARKRHRPFHVPRNQSPGGETPSTVEVLDLNCSD